MRQMPQQTEERGNAANASTNRRTAEFKIVDSNVSERIFQFVSPIAEEAIKSRGYFTIALSGGSLPKTFAKSFIENKEKFDWSRWIILLADERCVALDHPESNYKLCQEAFLNGVKGIPEENVLKLNISSSSPSSPSSFADTYESDLISLFKDKNLPFSDKNNTPVIDCVFLGMGPDGHTCSLFPDHPLLEENSRLIADIYDSPKPPPQRITFTFRLLSVARYNAFVITGEGKSEMVARSLNPRTESDNQLPVSLVNSRSCGKVIWFLDPPAASKL